MSIKLLKKVHNLVGGVTGHNFSIVGGAVRDSLYGVEPKDYDCVLCTPDMDEQKAFAFLEELSEYFAIIGGKTYIYQSYGLNLDVDVNPDSFQAMFLGCMKVNLCNCSLDILLSRAKTIKEHVLKHDCNMNMVWFDGKEIRWEHDGKEPKVDMLQFNFNVSDERINYMDIKRHNLIRHEMNLG